MVRENIWDLVIIGGGSAGMAAAIGAKQTGLSKILILDRNALLGGVLPQCIHQGFGLFQFGSSLTGPEYAKKWREQILKHEIPFMLNTTVLKITGDGPFILKITGPECGLDEICCHGVIIASGCREKSLGQLRIPGSRPAGIFTAGAAQYMMNVQNYLPGKSVVILGLGDIGLIMARRLTLEGVKVKLILGERAGGLLRNYLECVYDFKIPVKLGYTIVSTHGYQRLKGVTIAPITSDGEIIFEEKKYIPCDTLLIAAGLIPETELWKGRGGSLSVTKGIPVESEVKTAQPGIFACGNVVRVYDTADEVSEMGRIAGIAAAQWVLNKKSNIDKRVSKVFPPGKKLSEEELNKLDEMLICTLCPTGCCLTVKQNNGQWFVEGNSCPKGKEYALADVKLPKRVITTTVRILGGQQELLPVKTDQAIAKEQIPKVMSVCRKVRVQAPILEGTVIVKNVANTGANIVATGDVEYSEKSGETYEKK